VPVVGQATIDDLRLLAAPLRRKTVRNVNSTAVGGGVAEILNRLVPLLRELDVDAHWDVIKGGDEFFAVTKRFHNALHGAHETFAERDFEVYRETVRRNIPDMDLSADVMFIHDPQPAGLIEARPLGTRWVWRCHIDLSNPSEAVWQFLAPYVSRYDASVFSAPQFARDLPIPQVLISPSIDPLSDKNRDLEPAFVQQVLEQHGIAPDRPLITQISRFDRLKDPVGVVAAYRLVKKYVDCQLLLAGGGASDDPEGAVVLAEVYAAAADDPDIHILELPPTAHVEINALQRASTVIVQKSLKEGFGLTVTEALWKAKPVVAGAVGGIPLQITHKHSGLLAHTIEGVAFWLKQLLTSPEFAHKLGENGREHVRNNFLLTRHLREYLLLFLFLEHTDQRVLDLEAT
jgi:trehalose synthase